MPLSDTVRYNNVWMDDNNLTVITKSFCPWWDLNPGRIGGKQ